MQMEMKSHVELLAWINAAFGAFGRTMVVFAIFTSVVALQCDERGSAVIVMTLAFITCGFLYLCLLSRRSDADRLAWLPKLGPALTLIVAILNLVNVPIGTVAGIYAFWALTRVGVTNLFARQ